MFSCKPSANPIDTKSKLGGSSGAFLVTILSRGLPNGRQLFLGPVRKLSIVMSEACWLRNLLLELHHPLSIPMIAYCDNVALGHVRVHHVLSRYRITDFFTKGLPPILFTDFQDSLSVRRLPAATAGVY
ncbi:hypothetical protein LIER_23944 [Lithospermum erythrorhizon]|uniref:Uncharacterized protein n=1 Tax=Lithospermum erythrorhizon TaxID=34254 RepID=A0AAV3R3C2_LITER